jgi:hypothetical protein
MKVLGCDLSYVLRSARSSESEPELAPYRQQTFARCRSRKGLINGIVGNWPVPPRGRKPHSEKRTSRDLADVKSGDELVIKGFPNSFPSCSQGNLVLVAHPQTERVPCR